MPALISGLLVSGVFGAGTAKAVSPAAAASPSTTAIPANLSAPGPAHTNTAAGQTTRELPALQREPAAPPPPALADRPWSTLGAQATPALPARPPLAVADALLAKGTFEEEANLNLPAAMAAYQSLLDQFDRQRAAAAQALFRLGECYRKLGQTNEARSQYERVCREFSDQSELVSFSAQRLPAAAAADFCYSARATIVPLKDRPEYDVVFRLYRVTGQGHEATETLVAEPRLRARRGAEANSVVAPEGRADETLELRAYCPAPGDREAAFCQLFVKRAGKTAVQAKVQLQLEAGN